jgi:acyl transferase domain-containing protein
LLSDTGLDSIILKILYAFHSSQIDPILPDLKTFASAVTFHKPKIPVVCPLDGGVVDDIGKFNVEYLARHCREPVNMFEALLDARSGHVITDQTTMLEIGPHPAVSSMIKATLGPQMTTLATSQRGREIWQVLGSTLGSIYMAGADIRWAKYHHDFETSHKVLSLLAYSWDTKHY